MRAAFIRGLTMLVLLGSCSPVFARADKECNGDVPLLRCTGVANVDSALQKVKADENVCAAMKWRTAWLKENAAAGADDELVSVKNYAGIVAPEGQVLFLVNEKMPPVVEVSLCWIVKPIASKRERPAKVPDISKPARITCTSNPAQLREAVPAFGDIGNVSIDPDAQQITFFGLPMTLVLHSGSSYLGISEHVAVTVDKRTGAYTIVLADGATLSGSCAAPTDIP